MAGKSSALSRWYPAESMWMTALNSESVEDMHRTALILARIPNLEEKTYGLPYLFGCEGWRNDGSVFFHSWAAYKHDLKISNDKNKSYKRIPDSNSSCLEKSIWWLADCGIITT